MIFYFKHYFCAQNKTELYFNSAPELCWIGRGQDSVFFICGADRYKPSV